MATLHLLGTGAALSDPHRTTTMLAFENDASLVVVDCGGDAVQRLMAAGAPLDKLEALIVTHEHPDHVGGFPLFMEKLWLFGRRRPLPVYGIRPAITQAQRAFATYDTSGWTGMPAIDYGEVAEEEGASVLASAHWRISASPGRHAVPVIGLRVEDKLGGGSVAYSCDTEKSAAIARLASGCDLLVHEATGGGYGHSSAKDAAEVAREAGAGKLVLVHLPPDAELGEAELNEARKIFPDLVKGEEGGKHRF